ncbi:unnamed protein product, partial [Meganyctiphanes norvegica]
DFCDEKGLPFLEMKGAFLLSKLEWENIHDLKEILEFAHKGFSDFFSAKCIESKLHQMEKNRENHQNKISRGNIIRKIILDTHGEDFNNLPKYQNILQLLGGILALKDDNLVENHGHNIIDIISETGVSNNTQWFDIYSDLNLNPTSAAKFGQLIAPHLDLNDFTIKDADVEVLSTLLLYVDIDKVKLDLSSTVMPAQLPILMNVLRNNKCSIIVSEISNKNIDLWNSVSINTKLPQIITDKINVTTCHDNLPFLAQVHKVKENCNLQGLWRELHSATTAPDMSRCKVEELSTSVNAIQELPTTVEYLRLGLLEDPDTGFVRDPGLDGLAQHCKQLQTL